MGGGGYVWGGRVGVGTILYLRPFPPPPPIHAPPPLPRHTSPALTLPPRPHAPPPSPAQAALAGGLLQLAPLKPRTIGMLGPSSHTSPHTLLHRPLLPAGCCS